ncbi:MAG TPA: hypothetical protein VLS47_08175 [Gallionella sp.]|nr:hypothetical protein [Gallionella sp.]
MNHPDFFDAVPRISLYDPLAEFLGATTDGILEYGYFDAVRLAGHSCPTVAAAYWSTCKALASLYPDAMPVRGDIRVEFNLDSASGVTGVIANVVSMLTGAMSDNGFKGLAGRFDRRKKLFFAVEMPGEMRFTRLDTGRAVQVATNLKLIPASPRLPALMASCLSNTATAAEAAEFRQLWQARVRSILLEHGDDPAVFVVTPA